MRTMPLAGTRLPMPRRTMIGRGSSLSLRRIHPSPTPHLALACLLETARKPTVRLWAKGSPIETKDLLRARSYRWSGRRRCWYIDLDEDQLDVERTFLGQQIYGRPVSDLPADRFTARDRFSMRTNPEIVAV